tara:strand:- start:44 stop:628 length:585 start_codon:yes stop_codon:yes gene_type:complete
MKTIKLKNCLLFMTAINSIGSKWEIKEYEKLFEGDMIKKLTLYIAIAYYNYKKYHSSTNFRRFANDLTGKNLRTGIQFQWDDGTIIKFEEKDFVNSCMFKTQSGERNPYWKEDPSKLKCPQTPMEFMFKEGFIDTSREHYTYFAIKHDFGMEKYMKRTLDFLLETPYYKESLRQGSFYFPVLTSMFKEHQGRLH